MRKQVLAYKDVKKALGTIYVPTPSEKAAFKTAAALGSPTNIPLRCCLCARTNQTALGWEIMLGILSSPSGTIQRTRPFDTIEHKHLNLPVGNSKICSNIMNQYHQYIEQYYNFQNLQNYFQITF